MRPATQARRQDLAARLAGLAEAEIAANGLAELRARTLAAQAGCSVGAIYGVVPDLDELVLAVNARTLDAIGASLSPAAGGASPAAAYLDYAQANRPRWTALFQHRMADRPLPGWYAERRRAAFAPVEHLLARLLPALSDPERAALAASLFAAVHGMVSLGLDELLGAMPLPVLRRQLRTVVTAMAAGLTER